MVRETAPGYINPQYYDLLADTAFASKKNGLTGRDINLALRTLEGKEPRDINECSRLLRRIANGTFPFVVVIRPEVGTDYDNISFTASLIPNSKLLKIESNEVEITQPFEHRQHINIGGREDVVPWVCATQIGIFELLGRPPKEPSYLSGAVAVGKGEGNNTLSLGFPYSHQLKQIEMGILRGVK